MTTPQTLAAQGFDCITTQRAAFAMVGTGSSGFFRVEPRGIFRYFPCRRVWTRRNL